MEGEVNSEPRVLHSFEKLNEILELLHTILSLSLDEDPPASQEKHEEGQVNKVAQILDEYQEQPYLLDPHLDSLVTPVIQKLRNHALDYVSHPSVTCSSNRVRRISFVIYSFMKMRGRKTIANYFPHEVSDVSVVIAFMNAENGPAKEDIQWPLRYIMLLWISLVCMIPFDLAQFDEDGEGQTARALEEIGKENLKRSGMEREGGALLLSRLYTRKDMSTNLSSFFDFAEQEIKNTSGLFSSMGVLQVFVEIAKSAPTEVQRLFRDRMLDFAAKVSRSSNIMGMSTVRKCRLKLLSRIAMRMLPPPSKSRQRRKALSPNEPAEPLAIDEGDNDFDIPEEVEDTFEALFEGLQDGDTTVRWSAAKSIARICERLPVSDVDQVLDNILGFYTMHSSDAKSSMSNIPATAEHPWHGATLACAELARRSLVPDARLSDILKWTSKALMFDIRKGTFSIGANVRDAAAYVLWSLARSSKREILEPFSLTLAQNLVIVSLFDREVHIRRAASAAFQEHVGRLGLFPHGIGVLAKTDFFSVGVRRNAFLIAAPQVAVHEEYLHAILDHLLGITLRHWDESMRRLGSQSLALICASDILHTGQDIIERVSTLLQSVDVIDMHGGLLALSELYKIAADQGIKTGLDRRKTFEMLSSIPSTLLSTSRNHLVAEAACLFISNALSTDEIHELNSSPNKPYWRQVIQIGLHHRSGNVQEAATLAMASLTRLTDCSDDLVKLIAEFTSSSPSVQQSLGRLLGEIDYRVCGTSLNHALPCLLRSVEYSSQGSRDVETRKLVFTSLAKIVSDHAPVIHKFLPPETVSQVFVRFFKGLEDYTVNERGDVGSWIRMACIKGLCKMIRALVMHAGTIDRVPTPETAHIFTPGFDEYLSVRDFHTAIGGILKQGVERLDNVRQCAGEAFLSLLNLPPPVIVGRGRCKEEEWTVREGVFFAEILETPPTALWNESAWLYPRAVRFLEVEQYRHSVLKGLVLSIGSRTGSTQQAASLALRDYVRTLDPFHDGEHAADARNCYIDTLIVELTALITEDPGKNGIVIPVLQTFNVILEGDTCSRLLSCGREEGVVLLKNILSVAVLHVEKFKNIQRVEESMRIVVNIMSQPSMTLRELAIGSLGPFLRHNYPKVRADTAEALYTLLQTNDELYDENLEELLLETEWSKEESSELAGIALQVVDILKSVIA